MQQKTNYLITDFTSGENESMPISSCEDDKYEPTLSRSLNNVQHSIKKITKTTCNTVLPIHSQCAEFSTYFELFQAKKEKVTDNFYVTSPYYDHLEYKDGLSLQYLLERT